MKVTFPTPPPFAPFTGSTLSRKSFYNYEEKFLIFFSFSAWTQNVCNIEYGESVHKHIQATNENRRRRRTKRKGSYFPIYAHIRYRYLCIGERVFRPQHNSSNSSIALKQKFNTMFWWWIEGQRKARTLFTPSLLMDGTLWEMVQNKFCLPT